MLIALLLAAATATANPCTNIKNPPLCRDLIEIYDRDQAVRQKWIADPKNAKLIKEMAKTDAANLGRVKSILNLFGWPGKTLVGERASAAAWTVVHHADLATQKMYIDVMAKAADVGELRPALFAQSIDRIAIREGRKQTYGTQFHEAGGAMIPDPIDDEEHVDERRAKVGLPSLAEHMKTVNAKYNTTVKK